MKLNTADIRVWNYAEGGEVLLGVTVRTKTGYSLYKPLDKSHTDWERVASSKNPRDFDKILFGNHGNTQGQGARLNKPAKNNIEEISPKQVKLGTNKKGIADKPSSAGKKVKKSFL